LHFLWYSLRYVMKRWKSFFIFATIPAIPTNNLTLLSKLSPYFPKRNKTNVAATKDKQKTDLFFLEIILSLIFFNLLLELDVQSLFVKKHKQVESQIYAEVVNFWGRVEAKDCQLHNEEVAQLRNKTLKTFLRFCVHIYCRFYKSK